MAIAQHPTAKNHEIKTSDISGKKKDERACFLVSYLFIPSQLSLRKHALLITILREKAPVQFLIKNPGHEDLLFILQERRKSSKVQVE